MKEQFIMVCPKCKSIDVHMDTTNPLQPAMGLPVMYNCNNCKFSGYHFPEVEVSKLKDIEVNKEHINKDKTDLVDTSYGKFTVNVYWKIISPITLLIGLYLLIFKDVIYGSILTVMSLFTFYIAYIKKKK
jgi:hypothetical protein